MSSAENRKRFKKGSFLLPSVLFALLLVALFLPWIVPDNTPRAEETRGGAVVRDAFVSGTFYPSSVSKLTETIDEFYKQAADFELPDVKALVVPHAGYKYSGAVAGVGFKALKRSYKKVFILAVNHTQGTPSFQVSVSGVDYYETPLGKVKVSPIAKKLLERAGFSYVKRAHTSHIIEVQLPFLQKRFSGFEIVPIVMGTSNPRVVEKTAEALSQYLDEETLVVISADLSHYHPYEEAVGLDKNCIKHIAEQDFERVASCESCGLPAIQVLLYLSKAKGWKAKILDYKNSGDTSGSKNRVVGYSSILFYEEPIQEEDQRTLLKLSRSVLEQYVNTGSVPDLSEAEFSERLKQRQACFVTLEKSHQLRGCIGHLQPEMPLYECVLSNTMAAAAKDPRFPPVGSAELTDIDIEVSVLSLPERYQGNSPEELLAYLEPHKHGVILQSGSHRSTYLPQVWKSIPDKKNFLSRLCRKGGSAADCWKRPRTEIYTYRVSYFNE